MINSGVYIIIIFITRGWYGYPDEIRTLPIGRVRGLLLLRVFLKVMAAVLPCPRSLGNSVALIGSGIRPADFFNWGACLQPPKPPGARSAGAVFFISIRLAHCPCRGVFFLLFRVRLRLFFLHAAALVVGLSVGGALCSNPLGLSVVVSLLSGGAPNPLTLSCRPSVGAVGVCFSALFCL